MPRGGKRKGTGRPKRSGESREPTKTVRVPLSFAEKIPELLKQHQEEHSVEDLKLPAKAHEECLPLEGLAWDAFEAFCLDLIARLIKPQEIYHYGTQGDNQHGIDIVADLSNGEKWVFQCKQWQKFNRSDATKVIESAKEFEADRYILLLSRVASVEVRNVIDSNPAWEVWDVRDISQKVRDLASSSLEVARRLVRDHFHPEWQNAFLGISKLNPFVSSEDFFHSWLNANQLFNHTWKLEGRNDALKSLHEFVASSDEQIAILLGRGGIGKTKLLYEFAKTFQHPDCLLWFVKDEPVTPENVDNLPLYPCVVVLDDAHQREVQDLVNLCNFVRNRTRSNHPTVKLIFSSRPHAVQSLQTQLDRKGIDYLKLDELKELASSRMKALARQALGQDYAHFADQLAAISHDSPLVTVIGGQLLAKHSISPSLLERNEKFQHMVLSRFEDVLIGQVSQQISPELCKKILELVAAIAPIRLTDKQFQKTATEFLKIEKRELIESLSILERAGVLLRRGNQLKITPDVLADHILHNACLTEQGTPTGYEQEVFDVFREFYPTQVLRNLAELDWRVRSSSEQETDFLDPILRSLKEAYRQASNLEKCKLLELIKEVAYYQPEYSLEIVQFAIRHPGAAPEDDSVQKHYYFTHSDVLSKLPEVLRRISYTLDYVPICCDLLWQLGRDDSNRPYNNPPESIRILIDLAKYGTDKPIKFNWQILESIERWLQEPDVHDHIYSPLDILDSFFEKEIRQNDYDGTNLKISTFLVDREITQPIRGKALKIVKSLLNSNNIKVSLKALESLGKALEELHDRSSQPLTEANQWWEPEQLEILEVIHSLVTRDIEPLIQLEAIKKLDSARWSSLSAVQQKMKNVIASIPQTHELKLTGALTGNYRWNPQLDKCHFDWREPELVINKINRDFVESFLQKYSSPQQGMHILNERLTVISANGGDISTGFLTSLAALYPGYSMELCEEVLRLGDCPLAIHIASILYQARTSDIKRAIKIFQSAVGRRISSFCQSFAGKYWAWESDIAPDIFRDLIQTLLSHPVLEVRKSAIKSLAMLIQSQPQLAISLALSVEIGENTDLAEKLFNALSGHSLEFLPLREEELRKLLCQLERVRSLNGYHISKFLVCAAKKIPASVLQLILKRIDLSVTKDDIDYDPLPSIYLENCLHYLSSSEEYEDILRGIRDRWFNQRLQMMSAENCKDLIPEDVLHSFKLEPLYKELYEEASFVFIEESKRKISPVSLNLLNEWINSENVGKIKAASRLIRGFQAGFIFGYLEFVSNLLERAYKAGDECYEAVSSNLFTIAVSGVKMGIPGQPFPEDVKLRDQASAIAKQFLQGSPVRKFFDSLVVYAEADIKFHHMFDEEHWD